MTLAHLPFARRHPADPGGLLELLSVDAATVREDSISLVLTFTDGVVHAVFTAFPLEAAIPLDIRLTWNPKTRASWTSCSPLLNATDRTLLHHYVLGDLAHRLGRFLQATPDADHDAIRAFADRLVPQGD
ncbi:MAG: hypothetical protein ABI609_01060 [Acidobacteriota bacterium]